MLVWDLPTNGLELLLAALTQVLVVLLTALLTWWIARGADKRADARESRREYERQLDEYSIRLKDATYALSRMVLRDKVATDDDTQLRDFNRFLGHVIWKPKREHVVVDAWAKSRLTSILLERIGYDQQSTWDESRRAQMASDVSAISTRFERWLGGEVPLDEFRDGLTASSFRHSHPRFGDPLSDADEGRWSRLRTAARDAMRLLRRAWTGERP